MLQLLHTHSYCADYMNTTVPQATNLHRSELLLNLTLATLYTLFLPSSYPFIFITCYWQMVSVPCPLIYYCQCISFLLHRWQHYEAENPLLLHLRKEEWIIFIIYIYTMCYYQPGGGMIVFAINGFDLIWFDLCTPFSYSWSGGGWYDGLILLAMLRTSIHARGIRDVTIGQRRNVC